MVQDPDGEGKIVYLFLPLYKVRTDARSPLTLDSLIVLFQRGNLQDAINANVVNGTHFPEQEMVRIFKGTSEAVRAMHTYRAPIGATVPPRQNTSSSSSSRQAQEGAGRHSDDDERFPQPEGDSEGGYSYGSAVNVPLMTNRMVEEEGDVVFDGDEELSRIPQHQTNGSTDLSKTEIVPYAHRDLKPG